MAKTALIAGSTGLVGGHLLKLLIESTEYNRVIALVRNPIDAESDKLEVLQVNFDDLENELNGVQADDVFCCLGTTMKKAGSKEKFKKVDLKYPVDIGRQALAYGASTYLLISAIGADTGSSFFYNQVKGEVEEQVGRLGYNSVHIFRPSLLLGGREETRIGEKIAETFTKALGFLFIGPLKKYKGIEASKVANAMFEMAQHHSQGIRIYESDDLQEF